MGILLRSDLSWVQIFATQDEAHHGLAGSEPNDRGGTHSQADEVGPQGDGAVAEHAWHVADGELKGSEADKNKDGQDRDTLEWVNVLERGATGVQDVEDLHVGEGLVKNEEHLALVGKILEGVVFAGADERLVLIQPVLVDEEGILRLPLELGVNKGEEVASVVVESSHGAHLEDSNDQNAELEVLSLHVTGDSLGAREVNGSPSLNHVSVAALVVLSDDAGDSDGEVDEVDEEDEGASDDERVVEEHLSEHHRHAGDTSGHLQKNELHQVVFVATALGDSHDDIFETILEENHIGGVLGVLVALLRSGEGDLCFLKHLDIVVTAPDGTNAGYRGHSLETSRTEALDSWRVRGNSARVNLGEIVDKGATVFSRCCIDD